MKSKTRPVLYIGNHLDDDKLNPTTGKLLAQGLKDVVQLRLVSRYRNWVIRLMDMFISVLRYGWKEQPVVIDVYSTLNFYYAVLISAICRFIGMNYMCVLHGGALPGRLDASRWLSNLTFGGAKVNIAPSDYLGKEFSARGYKVRIVPNAIQIARYPFKQRIYYAPRLLWVRAFAEIYDPAMAIQVLERLMKTYPASTLCMVGPDKDGSQEKCRDLVRSVNLTGSLLFTGKLSKEDWWELSGQYDIFLNTSTIDNTPVSVIEAMALGLPVVSTDVGGMRYLIEQGSDGILVESGDVDAMVLAICDLVEGRINGASLALKARAKVEKMDLAVVVSEWCKILEVDT